MPLDGITLGGIIFELNSLLSGGRIDRIQQPEKDEIILLIKNNARQHRLLISANAGSARLHITRTAKENPETPPNFCMLLRKHLSGGRILSITQPSNERIANIAVESCTELGDKTVKTLIAEIMGKHSNIILVNSQGFVIDAIKRVDATISSVRQVMPHDIYTVPPSQNKVEPSMDNIQSFFLERGENITARMISDSFTGISRPAAEEIVFRIKSAGGIMGFKDYMQCVREQNYMPVMLLNEQTQPVDFLPFRYSSLAPERQQERPGFSAMLEEFYAAKDTAQHMKSRSRELNMLLDKLIEKCERKEALYAQKLMECAQMDIYRIKGELLTANLFRVSRGAKKVTVNNYYEENKELEIELDERISPQANAQQYFKKYNKLKTASKLVTGQISQNREEKSYLESLKLSLDNCTNYSELEEIRQELLQAGYIKNRTKGKKLKSSSPTAPHCYISSDGIEILVGKNNRQNDALTLKTALPNETWLHVKDMPGSHVIIRKTGDIPPRTLQQAANLAVYYSKGRASQNVPVDYTLVRYVKKPGGAKPGMVIYQNMKTLYITCDADAISALTKAR